ncbi:hypothetical protein KRX57_06925 [Weeksellaceae bacterium TAE3-ERU29]|nr:hypothetical protein [Weeksellaceae bacterium TAE3-ERU29]
MLYFLSAILIFVRFSYLGEDFSDWISLVLLFINIALVLVYSNFASFFKGTHYFELFFISIIILLSTNFNNLAFFSGFLFLNIVILQLLDERDMTDKILSPFDIGFFMMIAVFMYPPFWIFLVFLLLHYTILGRLQIQGLILSILGVLTIALLIGELSFLFDFKGIYNHFITEVQNISIPNIKPYYLWLTPIGLFLIISLIDYVSNINRHSVEKKITYFNGLMFLVFAIIFYIIYGGKTENSLLLFSIPIALILTNYILYTKLIYKEIILWTFIASVLLFKYSYLIELPEVLSNISF